jgi:hypothetical protein
MKKYLLLLLLIPLKLSAQPLCDRIRGGIASYLETQESRIAFKNQGGLVNGGVCWWHARLQRSSAYLLEFKPELPVPDSKAVKIILNNLKKMKTVIEIPGYRNFNSFTQAYQKDVQKFLESWQREDGFINQQWIRGVSGKYELSPDAMKAKMALLYKQFLDSPQPMWVMAQIKGVSSHAFLVLDMTPQPEGLNLKLVDSNYPTEIREIRYVHGQRFLKHKKEKYSFVPYLGFQKDYQGIQESVRQHCGDNLNFNISDIPLGDIELNDKAF